MFCSLARINKSVWVVATIGSPETSKLTLLSIDSDNICSPFSKNSRPTERIFLFKRVSIEEICSGVTTLV